MAELKTKVQCNARQGKAATERREQESKIEKRGGWKYYSRLGGGDGLVVQSCPSETRGMWLLTCCSGEAEKTTW